MSNTNILFFVTKTCPVCNVVEPLLQELGVDYDKIDAHDNPELTSKYSIMSAPVVVVLKDNKEVSRVVGYTTKEKLEGAIANAR